MSEETRLPNLVEQTQTDVATLVPLKSASFLGSLVTMSIYKTLKGGPGTGQLRPRPGATCLQAAGEALILPMVV